MASFRYPLNLGQSADASAYPFVQFQFAKFRERTLIRDATGKSSVVDPNSFRDQLTQSSSSSINDLVTNPLDKALSPGAVELANSVTNPHILENTSIQEIGNVYLPLPQNLENNYQLNWEMADQQLTNGIMDAFNADTRQGGEAILGSAVLSAVSGKMTQRIGFGTPNPKKQALFNGIEPRQFTMNYTFAPQSLQEAQTIEKIIKMFQIYSLPSLQNITDAYFDFPSEYRITFHNTAGFPDIKWCVCTGVQKNYAPNTMQLLSSGHSVQVGFTLTFLETSLRTQQDPGV